jgi:hypothetical protein
MSEKPTIETPGNAAAGAGSGGERWALLVALALLGGLYLLVWAKYRPPAPRPASAPSREFSAVRAKAMLAGILGGQEPHPVGSAADAKVREAIVGELRRLGYQPEVGQAFACSADGVCAEVRNVLARLDGREGGKAVLVAAHYDSVPAGPGASDDGAGVAALLEVARALKAGPALRHPVVFLFDEGEEAGLLGAVAFVEQNPWAREVGAAVNLEARGTSGPSLMFETGSHSLWLMPLFGRAVPRPLANSLYYAVYRRLPNDTDFSVFKQHGIDGFNFAFIDGVSRYHTPLDNLHYLDARSLQSQGEHALGLVRALGNAEWGTPRPGSAVFFDVAGWRMVWWPASRTLWMAAGALLLILICVGGLWARRELTGAMLGRGLLAFPAVLIAVGAVGVLALLALRAMGSVPSGWVAHPEALVAAFQLLGLSMALGIAAWVRERARSWGFWCATWLWWAFLALAAAFALPEASFPWLVPAVAAGVFGLGAAIFGGRGWKVATEIFPALVAGLMIFEIAPMLYTTVGAPALPLMAVLFAALGMTFAPLVADAARASRHAVLVALGVATVILAVVAAILPPYTVVSPQRMNFEFVQNGDTNRAQWLVTAESGQLPAGLRFGRFGGQTREPFPWMRLRAPAFTAAADPLGVGGPALQVMDERNVDGRVEVRARLVSSRVAPVVGLYFPPDARVTSFTMEGQRVPPLSQRVLRAARGWQRFVCVTTRVGGVDVSFAVEGAKEFDVVALDESYGLPNGGRELEGARPANAVASQSGDVTVMTRTVRLGDSVVDGQNPHP